MKTFTRTFLATALFFLCTMAAQAQENPFLFGVKAGMNASNLVGDANGKIKLGYQFGVTMDYALPHNFLILSGLEFTTKGTVAEAGEDSYHADYSKQNVMAYYLQLPVRIAYELDFTKNFNMQVFAGPYLAYGLGGKTKSNGHYWTDGSQYPYYQQQVVYEDEIKTFSSELLKEFDFGFGLGLTFELFKFNLSVGYDFGMINLYSSSGEDDLGRFKNTNAYVTLGYKF